MTGAKAMRRPASRFLTAFLLGLLVFFGAVLAVTASVDPFGLSPVRADLGALNAVPVERRMLDRMIKPVEAIQRQPKTLILGTSRVRQGFDPDDFAGTEFAPVYNLGINFSSLTESIVLLQAILPFLPSVENIIFEFNFVHYYYPAIPKDLPTDAADLVHDLATAFLSVDALTASVRTVLRNKNYRGHFNWTEADGMMTPTPVSMIDNVENFFENAVKPGGLWQAGPQQREMLQELKSICDDHGIRCMFAILPYLPIDLAYYDTLRNWPGLEAAKRDAMQAFPVLDLTMYNKITQEPLSDQMRYWDDVNHFKPLVGGFIADRLAGRDDPEIPENFGIWLTPENFDATMAQMRAGRDAWKAAHPDALERIRKTLDRKGWVPSPDQRN